MNSIQSCVVLISSALFLASCGGGSSTADGGNSKGGFASLSLDLVDAPVDSAANVFVRVQGVTLHSPGGENIVFHYCSDVPMDVGSETALEGESDADASADAMAESSSTGCLEPEAREIDLLALTGGHAKNLLDGVSVPVGYYPWVRLAIDEERPGYIVLDDGTTHDLDIPGGANTGLKLVSGFSVQAGEQNRLLIDFDLRKSIHKAGAKYRLKPALRLVKMEMPSRQSLAGEWLAESMGECDSPMVYAYENADVLPDDMGGSGAEPLTTASFTPSEDGTRYIFRIDYLNVGDYTIAYTCSGEDDDPDSDDDLLFVQTYNAVI